MEHVNRVRQAEHTPKPFTPFFWHRRETSEIIPSPPLHLPLTRAGRVIFGRPPLPTPLGTSQVSIFEGSERGAAAVKFKHPDDAQRCVVMMRERSFGSEALRCELYDGVSDYRPRAVREAAAVAPGGRVGEETAEEQEAKLESFAQWLEADSTDDEADVEGGD